MIGDEVASGKAHAAISKPGEAKDAPVQSKNRELDDTNTPGVDEDIRECDLIRISNNS